MADLNINSKYKMLSGYDIPALGYGVSSLYLYIVLLSKDNHNYPCDWTVTASLKTRLDHVLIAIHD